MTETRRSDVRSKLARTESLEQPRCSSERVLSNGEQVRCERPASRHRVHQFDYFQWEVSNVTREQIELRARADRDNPHTWYDLRNPRDRRAFRQYAEEGHEPDCVSHYEPDRCTCVIRDMAEARQAAQ